MRDIIYRGKTKDGEWEYGGVVIHEKDAFVITKEDFEWSIMGDRGDYDGCITPVLPETVGQYTGLTDKNGKKIFEGDIVDCWSEGVNAKGMVKRRKDGMWIMYPAWQNEILWKLCPDDYGKTTVEVIGNVFDNPELLEVK